VPWYFFTGTLFFTMNVKSLGTPESMMASNDEIGEWGMSEGWPTDPGPLENPLGLAGFEFLEFAVFSDQEFSELVQVFEGLGFVEASRHRSKDVVRYNQGDINLILNREADCFARSFAMVHGMSVCAMAFRVDDAEIAHAEALKRGAQSFQGVVGPGELVIPAIRSVSGSLIYYVDLFGQRGSIYERDFRPVVAGEAARKPGPKPVGLERIDHVSLTVMPGRTPKWVGFFKEMFSFYEWSHNRLRDPSGTVASAVVSSPCKTIHLPINESADSDTSPNRFVAEYFGEGIQHIALQTRDLFAAMKAIEANGLAMLPMPARFYDELAREGEQPNAFVEELRAHNILIDTEGGGRFLHAYTQPIRDRFFFEIVQRDHHAGFGRRNAGIRLEALSELYASS